MGGLRVLDGRRRDRVPRLTAGPLWKLRTWLALPDAAAYLAQAMNLTMSDADVLRLCLDGHLPLSVYLPVGTKAREYQPGDEVNSRPIGYTTIDGLWDLLMIGEARRQVEHDYQWLASRNLTDIADIDGACVVSGVFRFRLYAKSAVSGIYPRSRSAFSEGSTLAIRVAALNEFAAAHRPPFPTVAARPETPAMDKPLGERERATLLTVIAALCRCAGIDVSKPSAAGATIEALTNEIGSPVPGRTIEGHLRRVPDALERRGKTSS
jgi:hypothetical protein